MIKHIIHESRTRCESITVSVHVIKDKRKYKTMVCGGENISALSPFSPSYPEMGMQDHTCV